MAAVSGYYCFLSMLANFLRSSNQIFLIPIVMQLTRNCISCLDQETIWRRPSCEVRNLGTGFDSNRSVTESLVNVFITSRIDYCNSLLYVLPNSHIMKLQRVQNEAARLVTGTPRFCHVTPLLFHLHWLPISYRIKFKILLLTFKCLYGQAPNYLIDLITIKKQSRYSLRSNESIFLELPGIKTHPTLGDRAFQSAAPYLCNALPSAIHF